MDAGRLPRRWPKSGWAPLSLNLSVELLVWVRPAPVSGLANMLYMTDETPDQNSQVQEEEVSASLDDAYKVSGAFQREIFRTQDSRLANVDALAGIVVAAAIAIATFAGTLVKEQRGSVIATLLTAAFCGLTVTIALLGRRERPKGWGRKGVEMAQKGVEAEKAVGMFQAAVRNRRLNNATDAAQLDFDAWYALSESLDARRKVKAVYFVLAVVALFMEVGFAIYLAFTSR